MTPVPTLNPSAPPVAAFHHIIDFIHADAALWVCDVSDDCVLGNGMRTVFGERRPRLWRMRGQQARLESGCERSLESASPAPLPLTRLTRSYEIGARQRAQQTPDDVPECGICSARRRSHM